MKIRDKTFRFFVVLLFSVFLSFTDVCSEEDKARQKEDEKKEKIVSILQPGISLIKYEIQRDQSFASRKMLISTLRQLRSTLKNDIGPKEQLINSLQLLLSKELASEIGSLSGTLEQEKTIIKNIQTSKRVRRVTRNAMKGLIPTKEQALLSFEKVLSEITNEISIKP